MYTRTETIEFERDVVFRDRRGKKRCFYTRAIVPMFIHPEELLVMACGEEEFKMILRDTSEPVMPRDLDNFIEEVRRAAEKEYSRLLFKPNKVKA